MVTQINNYAQFNSRIKGNKPVVIKFTAKWCGPCKTIEPKYQSYAKSPVYKSVLDFSEYDIEKDPELTSDCDITGIPTFRIYFKGTKLDEVVGASDTSLKSMLDRFTQHAH
jgi:thioredoxin 1